MVWPAVIAAGASLLGGMMSKKGQESANETNVALGREQMDFQERMSNTSYQRAVQDMQAAGLNPMLAYSQGGASAPMGSMPQVQNTGSAGVSGATQALNMVQAVSQMRQQAAQTELISAQAEKVKAETVPQEVWEQLRRRQSEHTYHSANLAFQRLFSEEARGDQIKADTALKKMLEAIAGVKFDVDNTSFSADVARRKAESDLRVLDVPRMKAEEQFFKGLGESSPYLRHLLMILRGLSTAGSIK